MWLPFPAFRSTDVKIWKQGSAGSLRIIWSEKGNTVGRLPGPGPSAATNTN